MDRYLIEFLDRTFAATKHLPDNSDKAKQIAQSIANEMGLGIRVSTVFQSYPSLSWD